MVFLSSDNPSFQSSIIDWSPKDPYNFYIDAKSASAIKLDTLGDEEQDRWASFTVSVLLKRGSHYMMVT